MQMLSNFFHEENSTLYAITNIHHKAGILLKVVNVFHNVNLNLLMVASIYSSERGLESQTTGNKMKDHRKFMGHKKFFSNKIYNIHLFILHLSL